MSGPVSPFIPPHPDASPAASEARVIPPTPAGHRYPFPPPGPAAWPQAAAGYGYPPPGHPARGRRNSRAAYEGMAPGAGGPPFDAGTYFGHPAYPTATATPGMPRALGLMTDDPWDPQGTFLTPDYGQSPAVVPPRPSPSHSRSRSRSHGGFPADWVGPRTPEEAGYVPRVLPVNPEFAAPWYASPGWGPATGYSTFTENLPPTGYGYGGPPHGYGHRRQRSAHATPWMGGGFDLPTTPGGTNEALQDPFDRAARPQNVVGTVDTRWFTGSSYGPVLDPLLASVVRCSFKINPLLQPPPEDPTKRLYLTWNMLFQSSYAHRSDERAQQSWIKGRESPATHPRLSSLRLISRRFSWFIDVRARSKTTGVTCGDLVDALSHFLLQPTGKEDYNALPQTAQARVAESYHYNRSRADDVPGGRLGEGMRRCDFLGQWTMWGGVEVDQRYVAERMSLLGVGGGGDSGRRTHREMVGVFVVDCEGRLPMTEEERRAEAARASE